MHGPTRYVKELVTIVLLNQFAEQLIRLMLKCLVCFVAENNAVVPVYMTSGPTYSKDR